MNIGKMWDDKFSRDGYLYGTEPNVYLSGLIKTLPRGSRVLFLGEGEGRNACFAAGLGMEAHAIDASEVGLNKLHALAKELGVEVTTHQLDLEAWEPEEQYDAVLCAFMHLEEPLRADVFVKALSVIAPEGVFAGEFFATEQLARSSGGPKDESLLYDVSDFEKLKRPWFDVQTLERTVVKLDEGKGHQGDAEVIRVCFRRLEQTPFKTVLPELTLKALLAQSVRRYAQRPLLGTAAGKRDYTYAQMGDAVEALQARLRSAGITAGDRVALCSENMPNWGVIYFAVTAMGAVIVPILPDFHDNEIRHIILHAECRAVCISRKMFEVLEHESMDELPLVLLADDLSEIEFPSSSGNMILPKATERLSRLKGGARSMTGRKRDVVQPRVREDDLAAIIYTSGTTGSSKGVMLTHRALAFQSLISQCVVPIHPEDRFLSILPLAHTYECSIGLLVPFANGASVTYLAKIPTPKILIQAMAEVKPTMMLSVPLVIEKIFKNRILAAFHKNAVMRLLYDSGFVRRQLHKIAGKKLLETFGGELRFFGIGGAPLSPMVEQFLIEAKFPYSIGYGLTETAPLIAAAKTGHTKLGAIGPAVEGVELRVKTEAGRHEGMIFAKGPNVMLGYFKDPEKSAEVLTEDGWFNTEDLGYLDEEGYLFVSGRSKNVILGPSGENIYPEQIEAILMENEAVEDALVYDIDKQLVARVHFDYEKLDVLFGIKSMSETKLHGQIDALLEQIKEETNERVSKFARLARMIEQRDPFVKTPTKKIKRYLYIDG